MVVICLGFLDHQWEYRGLFLPQFMGCLRLDDLVMLFREVVLQLRMCLLKRPHLDYLLDGLGPFEESLVCPEFKPRWNTCKSLPRFHIHEGWLIFFLL